RSTSACARLKNLLRPRLRRTSRKKPCRPRWNSRCVRRWKRPTSTSVGAATSVARRRTVARRSRKTSSPARFSSTARKNKRRLLPTIKKRTASYDGPFFISAKAARSATERLQEAVQPERRHREQQRHDDERQHAPLAPRLEHSRFDHRQVCLEQHAE